MRRAILGLIVVGIVSLAFVGSSAAKTVRVALLPVAVNSSTDDTGYLAVGLADMLSARLEQSGEISVVRLEEGSTDRFAAIDAAKKANADFVVFGSYTQFGDGASLDLRCAQVSGEREEGPRRVFIQAGSLSDIIPQLDELSERVTRYLVGAAVSSGPPREALPVVVPGALATPSAPKSNRQLQDLQDRVSALERVIFNRGPDDTAPAD